MLTWDPAFPGLLIDPRSLRVHTLDIEALHPRAALAFPSATRAALSRIASRPVGRDLLTLISKRCGGIGAAGPMTCRIMLGEGTLWNRHGTRTPDRYTRVAQEHSFGVADFDFSQPADALEAQALRIYRRAGLRGGVTMALSGGGLPAIVSYNPFISYDTASLASLGVPTPAFVALAHELVHALHILGGDRVGDADPARANLIEEARTIGCGRYENTRISENAIRAEHGLPLRRHYTSPGDCDASSLG